MLSNLPAPGGRSLSSPALRSAAIQQPRKSTVTVLPPITLQRSHVAFVQQLSEPRDAARRGAGPPHKDIFGRVSYPQEFDDSCGLPTCLAVPLWPVAANPGGVAAVLKGLGAVCRKGWRGCALFCFPAVHSHRLFHRNLLIASDFLMLLTVQTGMSMLYREQSPTALEQSLSVPRLCGTPGAVNCLKTGRATARQQARCARSAEAETRGTRQ